MTASDGYQWLESGLALIEEAGNPVEVNRKVSDVLLHMARRMARH